jgi:hypothetical protein
MLPPVQFPNETATPYPGVIDFFKTFHEELYSLYLLSFLLTADHDKAQQCLVTAVGEPVDGIGVFMDSARSWTRSAVVRCAIQMIMPVPEHADRITIISLERPATPPDNNPFAAILLLDAFERFVFVLSILEGQSEEECAILLRCSRRDVTLARVLALGSQSSAAAQA